MKAVLVDSDILIEVLRGRDAGILAEWGELGGGDAVVAYSPVAAAEIWCGARESERAAITMLFTALTCVPIDAEIGRKAGDYLRLYRRKHGVELGDALIAATAATHKLALWTRNRKHYPMRELELY